MSTHHETRETHETHLGTGSDMPAERCRQLLAATRIARVAFVEEGHPRLIVLNHLPSGDRILFQTSEDTALGRLSAAQPEVAVVMEVDSASNSSHFGWSVVASGTVRRIDPAPQRALPQPWRDNASGVVLSLEIDEISGRTAG